MDALSDDGRFGLTLIAFIGSVFSPWYRFARRGGRGAAAENHVCMNVALTGGVRRWAMTERGREKLSRGPAFLQIGASSLRWDGTVLSAEIVERTAPLRQRVRGRFRVHPLGLGTRVMMLDGVGLHRWAPVAPTARIEVEMDEPELRWQGNAYCDTNDGDAPLEEGFLGWNWCRAPVREGTAILYHGSRADGSNFCESLVYDAHGAERRFPAPDEVALGLSFWGMRPVTRSEGGAQRMQVMEDAPFYARSVVRSRLLGQEVTAVHESLSLTRFVVPVVQAMLPFKAPREGVFFF